MKYSNPVQAATLPYAVTLCAIGLLLCLSVVSAGAQTVFDGSTSGWAGNGSDIWGAANSELSPRKKQPAAPQPREAANYGPGGNCGFELLGYWNEFSKAGGVGMFDLQGSQGCTYQPQVSAGWIHLDSHPTNGPGKFTYTVDPNPSNTPRAGSIRLLNTQHMIFQEGEPGAPYVRLLSASPGATLLVNGTPTQTPAFVFSPPGQPAQFEAPSIWTVNSGERRVFQSWSNGQPRRHEWAFDPEWRVLYAIFETQFLLSISVNGPGLVSTTPYYTHGYHPGGATIILKATPSPGSIFAGWTGDFVSSENPAYIYMSRPRSTVANFVADPNAPVLSLAVPPPPLQIGKAPELLSSAVTIVSSGVPVSIGQPTVSCPAEPPVLQASLSANSNGVTPATVTVAIEPAVAPLYPKGRVQCTVSVPQSGGSGPSSFSFPVEVTVDRAPQSGADILAVVNGASFTATAVSGAGIFSLFGEA